MSPSSAQEEEIRRPGFPLDHNSSFINNPDESDQSTQFPQRKPAIVISVCDFREGLEVINARILMTLIPRRDVKKTHSDHMSQSPGAMHLLSHTEAHSVARLSLPHISSRKWRVEAAEFSDSHAPRYHSRAKREGRDDTPSTRVSGHL
jgi:hypothetical protein